jgi:hypothetical protein
MAMGLGDAKMEWAMAVASTVVIGQSRWKR